MGMYHYVFNTAYRKNRYVQKTSQVSVSLLNDRQRTDPLVCWQGVYEDGRKDDHARLGCVLQDILRQRGDVRLQACFDISRPKWTDSETESYNACFGGRSYPGGSLDPSCRPRNRPRVRGVVLYPHTAVTTGGLTAFEQWCKEKEGGVWDGGFSGKLRRLLQDQPRGDWMLYGDDWGEPLPFQCVQRLRYRGEVSWYVRKQKSWRDGGEVPFALATNKEDQAA